MPRLQFGWKAGPEQYPPTELLDDAILAEQAGFDLIESSDHFQPWSPEGQASFVWTWLGAVAARTNRIRLGTGVTCPILRYNPAIIAQAAATLMYLAPGRTYLSVGTGEALNEYASTGLWPPYDVRQARLAEAIDLMRSLWTGDEITFDGFYYQTRKARIWTLPQEAIPIYVSSLVPASAGFAGEQGDGLITTGGHEMPHYHQIIQNFDEAARNEGKDPASLPRMIELNVAYTNDTQSAVQAFEKYWAGSFVPALFDQKIYTPQRSAENGKVVGTDTIKRMSLISGNADDHVKYAQQYIDAGFTDIIFHSPGPDQRAFIEHYGRDVLPRLRQQQAQRSKAA
jgi:coenzyme F420-dependent glucose-6-phosphate dehydrogenase